MFKLNLKIAFRNLLKNKIYTLINIVGLALGLAGFIFVLLYVNHEKSYDHWHPQLENVYQVQELDHWAIKEGKKEWMEEADLRVVDLLKTAMPQVDEVARVMDNLGDKSILITGGNLFLQKNIIAANEGFFKVFPYHFVYGDATTALSKPGSLVVKETFAKKHFGNVNPVGKIIQINEQNWTKPELYTVTGVVAEPKYPSSINFELLQYSFRQIKANDNFYSFAKTFAKIKANQSLVQLNQTVQSLYLPFKMALLKRQRQPIGAFIANGIHPSLRFVPLHQVHQAPLNGKSWLSLIKPVILLSTLLLLISIINFINMFTAQAVSRAKEVGIKKVIGANRKALVIQFLLETAMQCVIALLLSVMLLEGFLPYLNQLFNLSLSFTISQNNLVILIELFALLLLITLFAGVYPAFFLSSYQPQMVLKGNYGNSHKGKNLRSLLVGLQFVIAVGFFVSIMIIAKQMQYMEDKDPGFEAKSVICINSSFQNGIANRLRKVDGVTYVGSNGGIISRNLKLSGQYKYNNQSRELNTVLVYQDGLKALGAKLIEGRMFDANYIQDTINTVILNESLAKNYGGNMVGKFIYVNDSIPSQVVGVIKDIQVSGFESLIEPTVYTAAYNNATGYPNDGLNYVIKFDLQKQKAVLAGIDKIWKSAFPNYPLTYHLVQDDLNKVLVVHERFKQMVKVFSFLSITLSLIGLFSLAAFLTKQRTKEIAIRKVLGADNKTIFVLLNKGYFWLMLAANVISWPLIYIAINYWLKGFAYRITIPLLPFVIAFVISLIVTIITVSLQVKNAISANPVNALKYE